MVSTVLQRHQPTVNGRARDEVGTTSPIGTERATRCLLGTRRCHTGGPVRPYLMLDACNVRSAWFQQFFTAASADSQWVQSGSVGQSMFHIGLGPRGVGRRTFRQSTTDVRRSSSRACGLSGGLSVVFCVLTIQWPLLCYSLLLNGGYTPVSGFKLT